MCGLLYDAIKSARMTVSKSNILVMTILDLLSITEHFHDKGKQARRIEVRLVWKLPKCHVSHGTVGFVAHRSQSSG